MAARSTLQPGSETGRRQYGSRFSEQGADHDSGALIRMARRLVSIMWSIAFLASIALSVLAGVVSSTGPYIFGGFAAAFFLLALGTLLGSSQAQLRLSAGAAVVLAVGSVAWPILSGRTVEGDVGLVALYFSLLAWASTLALRRHRATPRLG